MTKYEAFGIPDLPEVREGDDIAALLADAPLRDGDIVVVTSKIVSSWSI